MTISGSERKNLLFVNKKKQKKFFNLELVRQSNNSFLLLFFKKEDFLLTMIAATLLLTGTARAQVSVSTPADVAGVPPAFLANAKAPSFDPRGTPPGYTPDPDPRDFTSSYIAPGGGGPGGPPPGGGGAPPGGAAPPGGSGAATAATCIPSFGNGPYPIHIISSPGRLTIVGEQNHQIRRVYIGGAHPNPVVPAYSGDSIGHWDGNTLVVDTIAIKGQPGVHLLERWTKQKNGSLAIETTSLDAAGRPIGPPTPSSLVWRPDLSFVEDICEDFGEAFGPGYGSK